MHRRGKRKGNQGPLSTQGQWWARLMVQKVEVLGSRTYGCGMDRVLVSEMVPSMGHGGKGQECEQSSVSKGGEQRELASLASLQQGHLRGLRFTPLLCLLRLSSPCAVLL